MSKRQEGKLLRGEEEEEEEREEAGGEEGGDDEDDHDSGFVVGKQIALKDQLEMDKHDESLMRWKEQLLGNLSISGDAKPEPEVEFGKLKIIVEGREDIELTIPRNPEEASSVKLHFVLKERCKYKLQFEFSVRNEIVLGLTYLNNVFKNGKQVDKSKVMLGAYGPQPEPYTFVTEEEVTPHGMFVRGQYTAKTSFVDDDNKRHLEFDYTFEIKKEW